MRSPMRLISTRSAWWWPTTCTARSSRACSPRASTCCARSRWRVRSPTPRQWWPPPNAATGSPPSATPTGAPPRSRRSAASWPPARWASWCTSTATTGATTRWIRPRRSPGGTAVGQEPGHSPTSAATCSTCRSSSADRSAKSAARPSPRSSPVAPFRSVSPTATPRVRSATSSPRWKTRMSPLSRRSSKTALLERFPRRGWRTTCPTVWPSSCSDPKVRRRGICTAPASSRSRPTMSAATSAARGGCSSALSIPTSKAACRWTRAASGTAWPTYSPTRPARFLDQIAGIGELGPLPGFDAGLRGLRLVAAVAESADSGGAVVKVA